MQAFRDNHRIAVTDPEFSGSLWRTCGLCRVGLDLQYNGKDALGLNANIRLYRYSAGQRFGKHVDESVKFEGGKETGYTLLIYLNGSGSNKKAEALQGGETVFYNEHGRKLHTTVPQAGKALLHLHGDECLEHEALEVRAGCKYILRSDVVFAPLILHR